MACVEPTPKYLPHSLVGIQKVSCTSDGQAIVLDWTRAYPDPYNFTLGYNIYYSTIKEDVFSEGPKYLVLNKTTIELLDFTPGDSYYFAVRATEFDPEVVQLSGLPDLGVAKIYPEALLLSNITDTDSILYISDIDLFPNYGVVQVGGELISYTNKDIPSSALTGLTRGFLKTIAKPHSTDGYDGTTTWDPFIKFWKGFEDKNLKYFQEVINFAYPNYAYTALDGYKYSKDIVYSNLENVNSNEQDFPKYDLVGWRRTNPKDYLTGKCIGSYFGGEIYCADGYDGVGRQIRGPSVNDENNRRQELLLEQTGKSVVLLRRYHTGIRCKCFLAEVEQPDDRCPYCFGTGFTVGYEQFFNPRRSDGRILVRIDTADEDIPVQDGGLENIYAPSGWTLVYPVIKDRDIIILYDPYEKEVEEARYEIMSVTRNVLFYELYGAQKFKLQRIRKTDPLYKIKVFSDSSMMPSQLTTSINMGGVFLPHSHTVVVSEKILNISQINQLTSIGGSNSTQHHTHQIVNGIIQPAADGHTHTIML
jgi:hypothetical protein